MCSIYAVSIGSVYLVTLSIVFGFHGSIRFSFVFIGCIVTEAVSKPFISFFG
jgi:hypothetical protein